MMSRDVACAIHVFRIVYSPHSMQWLPVHNLHRPGVQHHVGKEPSGDESCVQSWREGG
jgi:hypothetical protein